MAIHEMSCHVINVMEKPDELRETSYCLPQLAFNPLASIICSCSCSWLRALMYNPEHLPPLLKDPCSLDLDRLIHLYLT